MALKNSKDPRTKPYKPSESVGWFLCLLTQGEKFEKARSPQDFSLISNCSEDLFMMKSHWSFFTRITEESENLRVSPCASCASFASCASCAQERRQVGWLLCGPSRSGCLRMAVRLCTAVYGRREEREQKEQYFSSLKIHEHFPFGPWHWNTCCTIFNY